MADFSKQYCEIWDNDMPGDFDIEAIADDLKPGYVTTIICEGFGFTAISKDEDGKIFLYFPDWEFTGVSNKAHWVEYDKFIQSEIKNAAEKF
jgi:hypothetical protein